MWSSPGHHAQFSYVSFEAVTVSEPLATLSLVEQSLEHETARTLPPIPVHEHSVCMNTQANSMNTSANSMNTQANSMNTQANSMNI